MATIARRQPYKKRASSANNEALLSSGPLRLGDKVGGPCSYRDDVEPSGVSETSMPLPQHPLCDLPAPLADPQHGKGRGVETTLAPVRAHSSLPTLEPSVPRRRGKFVPSAGGF